MGKIRNQILIKIGILMILSFFIFTLSACNTTCPKGIKTSNDFSIDPSSFELVFEVSTKGNAFNLTINDDGTYTFHRSSPTKLRTEGVITAVQLNNLLRTIEQSKFGYLYNDYICHGVTDAPVYTIRITSNGQNKTVNEYNSIKPLELQQLKENLYNLASHIESFLIACEVDENCIFEGYGENSCCNHPCRSVVTNKATQEKWQQWREKNCQEPRDYNDPKWASCLETYQCIPLEEWAIAKCINQRCVALDKEIVS